MNNNNNNNNHLNWLKGERKSISEDIGRHVVGEYRSVTSLDMDRQKLVRANDTLTKATHGTVRSNQDEPIEKGQRAINRKAEL
jgi:hypothetical protein